MFNEDQHSNLGNAPRHARQKSSNTGLGSQWSSTMFGSTLTNNVPVSAPQCFMLNACYGILLTDPLYNYLTQGYRPCVLQVNSRAPLATTDPSFVDLLQLASTSQPMTNRKGVRLPTVTPATRYCHRLFVAFYG
jgi:hypothetical protein